MRQPDDNRQNMLGTSLRDPLLSIGARALYRPDITGDILASRLRLLDDKDLALLIHNLLLNICEIKFLAIDW